MKDIRTDSLIATAALAVSCATCVAWIFNGWAEVLGPTVQFGLVAAGVAISFGCGGVFLYLAARRGKSLRTHLEALCELDSQGASGVASSPGVPRLRPSDPWSRLVDRLRESLLQREERTVELEHGKSVLEVRCRRANDQAEQAREIVLRLCDPVLVVNDYEELVLANEAARKLFGIEDCENGSRPVGEVLRPTRLVELLRQSLHRPTPRQRVDEMEIEDPDGEPGWYRINITKLALAEGGGGPGGAVAVVQPTGEQRDIRKRHAEFVSAVSHEMKTPLAGIKAYVELLADGEAEDEETREEFLDVISTQAERLQRLVENMLNLARIEAGVVQVDKKDLSLNELMEEAVNVVQPSAEAKQIELVSDLSPLYLGVLADRDMLLQSAINLLSNAIKYTPDGGRVTLRTRMEDEQVRFEVEDTGVGLCEEDCERVFEKFYRVHKDKTMARGTGLGLPLAKHIVEDVHSGRLTVSSILGEGSTFAVALPAAKKLGRTTPLEKAGV